MQVIQARATLMFNILKGPKIIASVQNIRGFIMPSHATTLVGSKRHPYVTQ